MGKNCAIISCLAPRVWATDLTFLYYGFGNGWAHVECLLQPGVIVLPEPVIDDDLDLPLVLRRNQF